MENVGAEANVQANWNESDNTSDAYIQNKPTNVSSFTNDAGYVTGSKIYVGECTTAAATVSKTCTVEAFPKDNNGKPLKGTIISVKFTNTNTAASPKLNVNSCGDASVWYNTGSTTTKNYYVYASRYITYMWDGTYWVWLSWSYDTNTTYSNVSLGQGYATQNNSSASSTITATLSSYALTTGGVVVVKFTYDVPASSTLNVNSRGAKAIYNRGSAIAANVIKAGDTATFIYNGTYYHLLSVDRWQNNSGGGGGSSTSEGKIVLYAIVDEEDDNLCTIQDADYETLTVSAVRTLLNDDTKDVVLRTYDPDDDPNYVEYRLGYYFDDTDYEYYEFYRTDGNNIYLITIEANRSYTNQWDYYPATFTIPTIPQKFGFGFGTQNNTSTSSVSASCANYKKVTGGIVAIKFTKALAHAPQLSINNQGSAYIYYRGSFCPANTIQSGDVVTMVYTGSVYEILSITKSNPTDSASVTWTGSSNTLQASVGSYKTYTIQDYSTSVPAGYNTVQFRFSKSTSYNVEPVTTLILRAGNYSNIDWENMNVSFYSQISGTTTQVTIKWKNNDDPADAIQHLGSSVNYVVVKVYEGEYGSYTSW